MATHAAKEPEPEPRDASQAGPEPFPPKPAKPSKPIRFSDFASI